jgi:hypothetical protein
MYESVLGLRCHVMPVFSSISTIDSICCYGTCTGTGTRPIEADNENEHMF